MNYVIMEVINNWIRERWDQKVWLESCSDQTFLFRGDVYVFSIHYYDDGIKILDKLKDAVIAWDDSVRILYSDPFLFKILERTLWEHES